MPTVQEQAIEWIHKALLFDAAFTEEIVAIVPTIPLSLVGMPYCTACQSVLCGACGHCHMLDIVPFSRPFFQTTTMIWAHLAQLGTSVECDSYSAAHK
jgi:hypothetical protein